MIALAWVCRLFMSKLMLSSLFTRNGHIQLYPQQSTWFFFSTFCHLQFLIIWLKLSYTVLSHPFTTVFVDRITIILQHHKRHKPSSYMTYVGLQRIIGWFPKWLFMSQKKVCYYVWKVKLQAKFVTLQGWMQIFMVVNCLQLKVMHTTTTTCTVMSTSENKLWR